MSPPRQQNQDEDTGPAERDDEQPERQPPPLCPRREGGDPPGDERLAGDGHGHGRIGALRDDDRHHVAPIREITDFPGLGAVADADGDGGALVGAEVVAQAVARSEPQLDLAASRGRGQ